MNLEWIFRMVKGFFVGALISTPLWEIVMKAYVPSWFLALLFGGYLAAHAASMTMVRDVSSVKIGR